MTLQDTLPLDLGETVRITKLHKGKRVAVSGALPREVAAGRLSRLRRHLPHEDYELTPVVATTNTYWRKAKR